MAILQHTNTKDKNLIISSFDPFISPSNYKGMVIGNDLDSILSECYLKKKFGWDILGTYDYSKLWY